MFSNFTKRQEEIIRISLELISEKGIQGLTIKNIAQKNNTAESAIYRHFSCKKKILHAIVDVLKKNSLPENYNENENAISQVEKTFQKHIETLTNFPAIVSVLFSEDLFKSDDSLTERIIKMTQEGSEKMKHIIKNGQEKGELRSDIDAEYLVILISGAFRMFIKKWKMSGYSFDLIEAGKKLTASIKSILTPCNAL